MSNMTEFEKNVLSIEEERIHSYMKDVEDAAIKRQESLEQNKENADKTLAAYNKMMYLVLIQTILMVTQTLLFAGIYFKL